MPKSTQNTEETQEPEETTTKKTVKKKTAKKTSKPTQQEFEKRVVELADKGLTTEKIGEQLRQENIHPKNYNKKISKILKEKDKYVNPDLKNMEEKLRKVREHYESNRQDKKSLKERERIYGKFRKLQEYFGIRKKKKKK